MNNLHLLSPVSLCQRTFQPSRNLVSLVVFLDLYHSIMWHILERLLPPALLCSADHQMSRTSHPFHALPSSAIPPGVYHSSAGYLGNRVCGEFLSVSRLWYATYLSGALFLIERLNRKMKRHHEKSKTEM